MKKLIMTFLWLLITSCSEQKVSYSSNSAFNAEYELVISQFGEDKVSIPKFESFPVQEIYNGNAKDFVVVNAHDREYESKLRNKFNREPVFAGEYVSVTWSCGENCIKTRLVNKRTGVALKSFFGGIGGERILAMRPDSRLIVIYAPVLSSSEEYKEMGYILKFEIIKDNDLVELQSFPRVPAPTKLTLN